MCIAFEHALRAPRSGQRRHDVLSIAAPALSNEGIRRLAADYSAIRIKVVGLPKWRPIWFGYAEPVLRNRLP